MKHFKQLTADSVQQYTVHEPTVINKLMITGTTAGEGFEVTYVHRNATSAYLFPNGSTLSTALEAVCSMTPFTMEAGSSISAGGSVNMQILID